MSISDRYWGTQVVQGKAGAGHLVGPFDSLVLLVSDASAVARLKGWTTVTITRNAESYLGLNKE